MKYHIFLIFFISIIQLIGCEKKTDNPVAPITTPTTNKVYYWERTNASSGGGILSLAVSGPNLFAGTVGGGAYLSTDNGESWASIDNGLPGSDLALAISGTNIFAGTDGGGVFLSTNSGASWHSVNPA